MCICYLYYTLQFLFPPLSHDSRQVSKHKESRLFSQLLLQQYTYVLWTTQGEHNCSTVEAIPKMVLVKRLTLENRVQIILEKKSGT